MLNCNVVKDLMPVYIDGLVSEETSNELKEHIEGCSDCSELCEQLKTPIDNIDLALGDREINHLKKIKKKYAQKIAITLIIATFIFSILAYFFAIGSQVKSRDINYTTRVENNTLYVDFKLTNGKRLRMDTDYAINKKTKKRVITLKPYEVFPSPIAGGSKFMWGFSYSGDDKTQHKVIIQFSDKDVVFYPSYYLK